MKANKIALIVCAILCLALVASACKSEEQLAQDENDPTILQPEVNITQEAAVAPDSLKVSGSGKVTLTPDTATFYVSILSEAKEAAEAQSSNAATVEAVTAAILGAGVKQENLQTHAVNLSEIYDYEKSPAVVTGYRMTVTLFVTVSPVEQAGVVIGQAVAAGATGTSGLAFTVADTSGAYQQALQAAIIDAAGKAAAMGEALGVELSAVPLSVTENSVSNPILYPENSLTIKEDALDTPISAGEISVTAQVDVVYEMLAPGANTP